MDAIARVNEDVQAVLVWSRSSSLRLNIAKTHVIILGSGSYVSKLQLDPCPVVCLDGHALPFLDTVRDLGLILDSKLSWAAQVNAISNRVHGTFRQLSASRRLLDKNLRRLITVVWSSLTSRLVSTPSSSGS